MWVSTPTGLFLNSNKKMKKIIEKEKIDVENLFWEIRLIKLTNKTTFKDMRKMFYDLMKKYNVKTPYNFQIWNSAQQIFCSLAESHLFFSFMIDSTPKSLIFHDPEDPDGKNLHKRITFK